jgi:endo-1,4-beta-xylanase
MKHALKHSSFCFLVAGLLCGIVSCKKSNADVVAPPLGGGNVDTATTLKGAASVPMGFAISYGLFRNDAGYRNTVLREADQVTFDYNMKHGAIVRDDGTFDYSRADEMFNLATSAGLGVFGHTLVWHENQNGNYLRSLTTSSLTIGTVNLLSNSDFEAGTGSAGTGTSLFTGWNLLIGGSAAGSFSAVAGNGSPRA